MTPNVLISQSETELESLFLNDFIAHVDGKKTLTLRRFYEEVENLLEIPDFGYNLDAFNDAINDLQWLEDERIVFYFTSTNELISKERDPAKMGGLLSVIEAAAEDWKWVDEDDKLEKKELIIVFEDSPRIRQILDNENVDYQQISSFK